MLYGLTVKHADLVTAFILLIPASSSPLLLSSQFPVSHLFNVLLHTLNNIAAPETNNCLEPTAGLHSVSLVPLLRLLATS